MLVLTGRANPELAKKICEHLGVPLGKAEISDFSDGEIFVEIQENSRGKDVFVIQPTCWPQEKTLLELLIMLDALKRASAKSITAVMPYYGYGRQDRKVKPHVPITAKLVADLITTAGADRILTIDLHAGQIQGFFNIPVDHLYAKPVLLNYVEENLLKDGLVVVAPDTGAVEVARSIAKKLRAGLAIIDKRRDHNAKNQAKAMHVIGKVKGRRTLIIDDMFDTFGTVKEASEALIKHGATEVFCCGTHAVLSGPAVDRINESPISELVVTDTIPLNGKAANCQKIRVLSVSKLLADAIREIHNHGSVSKLFI